VLGTESTGFVEDLVRLEAEAAADDFLHDLGGADEDPLDSDGLIRTTGPITSSARVRPEGLCRARSCRSRQRPPHSSSLCPRPCRLLAPVGHGLAAGCGLKRKVQGRYRRPVPWCLDRLMRPGRYRSQVGVHQEISQYAAHGHWLRSATGLAAMKAHSHPLFLILIGRFVTLNP